MSNNFFVIKASPKGNGWSFHNDFQKVGLDTFTAEKMKKCFYDCQPGDVAIGFDTMPFSSAYCLCEIVSKNEETKEIKAKFTGLLQREVTEREMSKDPLLSQAKFVKAITANGGRGITIFDLEKEEFDRIIELSKQPMPEKTTMDFTWVPFYMELADKFASYATKKELFVPQLAKAFQGTGAVIHPHVLSSGLCDPFSAIGQFNHNVREDKRIAVCAGLKKIFGLQSDVPTGFDGFPTAWYQHYNYAWASRVDEKKANEDLWNFFLAILNLSKNPTSQYAKDDFISKYDAVHRINYLTQQMPTSFCFWVRPLDFPTLDSKTATGIKSENGLMDEAGLQTIDSPDGQTYLNICSGLKKAMATGKYPFHTFPELSLYAYNKTGAQNVEVPPDNEQAEVENASRPIEGYTADDFVNEVFMDKGAYSELRDLLLERKNVILTGAPGVGKTFAASRLAYSIIGQKDDAKIQYVQFHQNYSYEDFVLGYKPTEDGSFKLTDGIFYSFCKRAEKDAEHPYFFIIDEINRGNLAKIFGELLMMIERDYRGKAVRLVYSDKTHQEPFTVPANVYIIGMMNTADRSIAMIDYALRRRFSFYQMKPAFDHPGFKNYLARVKNSRLDSLVEVVKSLNKAIDEDDSLGDGYEIGHSYFVKFFGHESEHKDEYSDEWLRGIVNYDLIPTLREYWFDNQDCFEDWKAKLRNAII